MTERRRTVNAVVARVYAGWAAEQAGRVGPDMRWAEADPSQYPEHPEALSAGPEAQQDLLDRTEAALAAAGVATTPASARAVRAARLASVRRLARALEPARAALSLEALTAGAGQGWRDQLRIPRGNGPRSGRWTYTPWKHLDDLTSLLNAVGSASQPELARAVRAALDDLAPFDPAEMDVRDPALAAAARSVAERLAAVPETGDPTLDDAVREAAAGIAEYAETDWTLFDEDSDVTGATGGRAVRNVWEGDLPGDDPVGDDPWARDKTSQELADELLRVKSHPVAPSPTMRRRRAAAIKELQDRAERDARGLLADEETDVTREEETDLDRPAGKGRPRPEGEVVMDPLPGPYPRHYVRVRRGTVEQRHYEDGSVTILDTSKPGGTNRTIGHTGPNPERAFDISVPPSEGPRPAWDEGPDVHTGDMDTDHAVRYAPPRPAAGEPTLRPGDVVFKGNARTWWYVVSVGEINGTTVYGLSKSPDGRKGNAAYGASELKIARRYAPEGADDTQGTVEEQTRGYAEVVRGGGPGGDAAKRYLQEHPSVDTEHRDVVQAEVDYWTAAHERVAKEAANARPADLPFKERALERVKNNLTKARARLAALDGAADLDPTDTEAVRAALNALGLNETLTVGGFQVIAWQGAPGPFRVYRARKDDGRTLDLAEWPYEGSAHTGTQSLASMIAHANRTSIPTREEAAGMHAHLRDRLAKAASPAGGEDPSERRKKVATLLSNLVTEVTTERDAGLLPGVGQAGTPDRSLWIDGQGALLNLQRAAQQGLPDLWARQVEALAAAVADRPEGDPWHATAAALLALDSEALFADDPAIALHAGTAERLRSAGAVDDLRVALYEMRLRAHEESYTNPDMLPLVLRLTEAHEAVAAVDAEKFSVATEAVYRYLRALGGPWRAAYENAVWDARADWYDRLLKMEPEVEDTFRERYGALPEAETAPEAVISTVGMFYAARAVNNNCVLASTAYELRRRGLDVHPRRAEKGRYAQESQRAWFRLADEPTVVEGLRGRQTKARSRMIHEHAIANYPPGSRGTIRASWKGRNFGHIWNWERVGDDVVFYDAQTGEVIGRDYDSYWGEVGWRHVTFQRLDNAAMRKDVEVTLAPPDFAEKARGVRETAARLMALSAAKRQAHREYNEAYEVVVKARDHDARSEASREVSQRYRAWTEVGGQIQELLATPEGKRLKEVGSLPPVLHPQTYKMEGA